MWMLCGAVWCDAMRCGGTVTGIAYIVHYSTLLYSPLLYPTLLYSNPIYNQTNIHVGRVE